MSFLRWILHSLSTDLSRGDYVGFGVGLLCALIVLGIVGLILYGIFYALDTAFVVPRHVSGRVVGKHVVDGWTQYINHTDANGNITSTTPIHHQAQYNVTVTAHRLDGTVDVGWDRYDDYQEGEDVVIWYRVGRLSGFGYVTGVGP